MPLSPPLTPYPYPCPQALTPAVLQRVQELVVAYLSPLSPYISAISPAHLPTSPLYLPYISLHLRYISRASPVQAVLQRVQELVVAHANVPSNGGHWSAVLDGAG